MFNLRINRENTRVSRAINDLNNIQDALLAPRHFDPLRRYLRIRARLLSQSSRSCFCRGQCKRNIPPQVRRSTNLIRLQLPEDLGITFKPSLLLEVTFPLPFTGSLTVKAGEQVPKNGETIYTQSTVTISADCVVVSASPPSFALRGRVDPSARYVISAVDPDAPPALNEFRHFLGADFAPQPIKYFSKNIPVVNTSAELDPWFPPGVPAGQPAHR